MRVCPPLGPFPSQPVQFLERTLVHSERLAASWTTQPFRNISTITISPKELSSSSPPKIIHGQWLLACELSRKFVVYDVGSETVPHIRDVLWEHDKRIYSWDAHSATSNKGLLVIVTFNDVTTDDQLSP